MYRRLTMSLVIVAGFCFPILAVNITGKVTGTGAKALSGAVVNLTSKKLTAITDASGNYSLKDATPVNRLTTSEKNNMILFKHGIMTVNLAQGELVQIELYTAQGNLIRKFTSTAVSSGNYSFGLINDGFAANMVMVRVTIGQYTASFRYIPFVNNSSVMSFKNVSGLSRLAKMQDAVDSLQVSASGYTPKTVKIGSYETIIDISLEAATCQATASKAASRSVNGSGPHKVILETNSDEGIKCGTIFRPADLSPGKNYPIFVWGEGGCSQNGFSNIEAMGEFASWGYFIVADGTPNGTGSCKGGQDGKSFIAYITWAIEQNKNPCSAYYQSLDTTKIAADGFSCGGLMAENASADPRFTAIGITSSGLQTPNDNLYNKIHTPFKIMNGGSSDMAYSNGLRDYEKISALGKPIIYFSKTNSGHGTGLQDPKGDYNTVNLAWLNWQLKGDTTATGKALLIGPNCKFCKSSGWEFKSANLP